MDRELMTKEVLCILDTRQIQRYIFRSNTFTDTIGGSDLVRHILSDAISHALISIDKPLAKEEYSLSLEPKAEAIPYFTDSKVLFQLISCTAGNALCIVRTGELCQKIIRKVSRYYLENGYSLNLAAAAVAKTDNMGEDINALYRKLNDIKASSDISDPLGALPMVMKEKRTGEPVVAFDEETGDYVSRASLIRREEAKKRKNLFEIKDIKTTEAENGKSYLAYIHADGNNLGITTGKILQTTPDYIEGIVARRKINAGIEAAYRNLMNKTETDLLAYYINHGGEEKDFPGEFRIIHRAGDDVNLVCNAKYAFPFLDFFYRNIKGIIIWEKDGIRIPLYVCAGISFVTKDCSFHAAFNLAEECCNSAKTAAKEERNLIDGQAGNWVDFQISDYSNVQELDLLRERAYHTTEGINLLLRPYSLNAKDQDRPYAYGKLMNRIHALKKLSLPGQQMKDMRQSYAMGRVEHIIWIQKMEEQGYSLMTNLGAPIYTDSEGQAHAVWFDAVELSDFV